MIKHRIEAREVRVAAIDERDLLELLGIDPTKHFVKEARTVSHSREPGQQMIEFIIVNTSVSRLYSN